MADRYQDRPFPAADEPRGARPAGNDPLAELARLIGQSDPFAASARPVQPQPDYADAAVGDADGGAAPAMPSWMQRANLNRPGGGAQPAQPELFQSGNQGGGYTQPEHSDHGYVAADPAADPSARYDDALYGRLDPAQGHDDYSEQAYPEPPYAEDETYDAPARSRRGGLMTVAAVLALAVVGTGGAFAYRTYLNGSRAGEPPVIKADTSPTKVVPAIAADASGKPIQDRMASGASVETLLSREEQPADPKTAPAAGPRVVLPPLNANGNPTSPSSVAPGARPATPANNGTISGDEPKRIRTLAVRPDQADGAALPNRAQAPAKPAAPRPGAGAASPVSNANAAAPLSLSPQGQTSEAAPRPAARVASAPAALAPASSAGGSYVVQVSSQRSEADAQASYRAIQSKFPAVLGSRSPMIKRADLGDKGVYYRAVVGPFGSPDEAGQLCGSLKTAGGQCVVQRN